MLLVMKQDPHMQGSAWILKELKDDKPGSRQFAILLSLMLWLQTDGEAEGDNKTVVVRMIDRSLGTWELSHWQKKKLRSKILFWEFWKNEAEVTLRVFADRSSWHEDSLGGNTRLHIWIQKKWEVEAAVEGRPEAGISLMAAHGLWQGGVGRVTKDFENEGT